MATLVYTVRLRELTLDGITRDKKNRNERFLAVSQRMAIASDFLKYFN